MSRKEWDKLLSRLKDMAVEYWKSDEKERERLGAQMETQLKLIFSLVKESGRVGSSKEEASLEKSYRMYKADPSVETFAVLCHDIETLADFTM